MFCVAMLRQCWSHSHSPGAGFTAGLLGFEVPRHRPGGCHPTRSCRALQTKAQPLPSPESNGKFGMLSWAPSPPLQQPPVPAPSRGHPIPLPSSILLRELACPRSWLQPLTVAGYSPELAMPVSRSGRAFGVISVLSPGSAFPPARSLHQQENCLSLTLIKP